MVDVGQVDGNNVGHIDQENSVDIVEKKRENKQKLQGKEGKREGRTCKVKTGIDSPQRATWCNLEDKGVVGWWLMLGGKHHQISLDIEEQ